MKTKNCIKKYYSPAEAMVYTGLSRGAVTSLAEKAGAIRRVGRRVLIDKDKLDSYLESQGDSAL